MQPNVPDFEGGPLSHIDADEVGRILVEYVDLPQAVQE